MGIIFFTKDNQDLMSIKSLNSGDSSINTNGPSPGPSPEVDEYRNLDVGDISDFKDLNNLKQKIYDILDKKMKIHI